MERPENDSVYVYNNNKKQKIQNELIINKSRFENLANETVYEIFQYFDKSFNSNKYHNNVKIKFYLYRINYLRLSNPFTVDIIFSSSRILWDYIQLQTLIFDNIDAQHLNNIFKHSVYLSKLHLLVFSLVDYVQDPDILFHHIFRLSKLKYCKIIYQTIYDQQLIPIYSTDFTLSPIEYFVLNNCFLIVSLCNLLLSLPKLRYLSIDYLVVFNYLDIDQDSIALECLKYVSINVDNIHFNLFQKLIKYFFGCVEVLRLRAHDTTLSSMSN
ncbi:unnamed protein product [Rotaria sp. Silwood2]|nr:unnamed protein product [Rotaria sp. Silwood2]